MNLIFDWNSGLSEATKALQPDVTLHSDSLASLFRFDWGLDTLQVGGRFTASGRGFSKLLRTYCLGSLNNIGWRFGPGLLADPFFVQRAIIKVIRAR